MIGSDVRHICCYLKEGLRDNVAATAAQSVNVVQISEISFNLSELDLFHDCEQMEYFFHA